MNNDMNNNMNQDMNNNMSNMNPNMNNINQNMNNTMNNMNQGMNNSINPNASNQFSNMNPNNNEMNNSFGGNQTNNQPQYNNYDMSGRIKNIIGRSIIKRMKPIIVSAIGVLLLIILYFLFIGGSKTLHCSKITSNVLEEINFNYQGKKAAGGKAQFTIEKSKVSSHEFETYASMDLCKETITDISKEEITSCKQVNGSDKITFTTTFKFDLKEEQDTIDEAKESFELDGYSCSIK